MIEITSKNNQVYKLFQKLQTKKYRDKQELYLIEGENLIQEALSEGAIIQKTVISRSCAHRLKDTAEKLNGDVFVVEDSLFKNIAQTKTSQGVIAAVRRPVVSPEDIVGSGGPGNFVVLDRLQDPGNIGTIIRTADAAGYDLVIAVKGTADVFSPKTVRAAAGSLFRIPVLFVDTEEELLRFTRAAGKKLTAASPSGSRYYYEEDLSRDIALIVGNEGNGVSRSLMEKADMKSRIPMSGTIESLNASVAAAILMYETVRAKGKSGIDM